ncbi:MAG: mechanosensitive ion channel family protein [Verrucomicrobiota bacterium]
MVRGLFDRLPYLVAALIVFLLFYLAGRGVRAVVRNLAERSRKRRNVGIVLGRLAQWVILFVGLLIALVVAIPSFKPGQLVQLLGISSVAIGFAFRDILQNFLAGILLLLREPFRVGDQIEYLNYEGTVEEVETSSTVIRTYDGRRIVIPNGELLTKAVTVNTASAHRRIQYDVGIGYGDNIARAKELMVAAVSEIDGVLKDPAPDAIVVDLAAHSVNIRLRWWVAPPSRSDAMDSRDRVLTAVKEKLLHNGIDLPFPTQHVLFHDQTEETDGDRALQREGWPAGTGPVPSSRRLAAALSDARRARPRENGTETKPEEPRGEE